MAEPQRTIKDVTRREDMSVDGFLRVIRQDDGDVIVNVWDGNRGRSATVEFCANGGGGKSPNTLKALYALMEAIAADNDVSPRCGVTERYGDSDG